MFSTFRKAEQNQVWVGMSKETAHQLGTPLSALYGWLQYFNANEANAYAVKEMNRDLERLNVIADRFSKIGSQPILQRENIILSVENILDYLNQVNSVLKGSFQQFGQEMVSQVEMLKVSSDTLLSGSLSALEGTVQSMLQAVAKLKKSE